MCIYSPTDDSTRPDSEHLRVKAGTQRRTTGCQDLGATSYFDPAHRPWINRSHVINYKRNSGILDDVAVLLPLGEATMTSDFDCVLVRVVMEANRYYMRLTIRTDGSQASETLTVEIRDLGSGESAHCLIPQFCDALAQYGMPCLTPFDPCPHNENNSGSVAFQAVTLFSVNQN